MNERTCHVCGHTHPDMAGVFRGDDEKWFCHEADHSCYEQWVWGHSPSPDTGGEGE